MFLYEGDIRLNGNSNMFYPYLNGYSGLTTQTGYGMQPQNTPNSVVTVFVTSEMAAQCYPVGAGNTVLLIDFDHHMFWIKSTDSNGVPMPMRTFDFAEKLAEQPAEPVQEAVNTGVSRDEFNELKTMFGELKATIEDVLK